MDRPLFDVRLAAASILVGLPVAVAVVVDLVVGGGGVGWVGVLPGLLAVAAFVAPLVQSGRLPDGVPDVGDPPAGPCAVDGCGAPGVGWGLCRAHYLRARERGER